jgi:uncharacterized protein (DUF4415 family)
MTGNKLHTNEPAPLTDAEGEVRELTEADFARFKRAEALPEVAPVLRPGRPPLSPEERKRRVTLFLDPDVVERLKEDGKGWQTRANAMLRKGLGL